MVYIWKDPPTPRAAVQMREVETRRPDKCY